MAEQLSNYWQPEAGTSTYTRMRMTQVMNPNAFKLSRANSGRVAASPNGGLVEPNTEDQMNACTAPVLVAQNDLFEAPPIGEKLEIATIDGLKLLLSH